MLRIETRLEQLYVKRRKLRDEMDDLIPQKISLDNRIDKLANEIHKANLDIHVANILKSAGEGELRRTRIEMNLEAKEK